MTWFLVGLRWSLISLVAGLIVTLALEAYDLFTNAPLSTVRESQWADRNPPWSDGWRYAKWSEAMDALVGTTVIGGLSVALGRGLLRSNRVFGKVVSGLAGGFLVAFALGILGAVLGIADMEGSAPDLSRSTGWAEVLVEAVLRLPYWLLVSVCWAAIDHWVPKVSENGAPSGDS